MKKNRFFLVYFFVAIFCSEVSAQTGDVTKNMNVSNNNVLKRTQIAALEKYDKNKNGVLDPDEKTLKRQDQKASLKQLKEKLAERKSRLLKAFDINKNGKLDVSEREVMIQKKQKKIQAIRAKIYEKYDLDHNGKLNKKEKKAIVKNRARFNKKKGIALKKYDVNNNKTLDKDEMEKLRVDRNKFLSRLRDKLISRFDKNGNGILDPQEKVEIRRLAAKGVVKKPD